MEIGMVKWYNIQYGFGLIETKDDDIIVFSSDIIMDGYARLTEGQRVQFNVTITDKGSRAMNVEVIL